jgi:transcriptional regulator with XRE-family HTH domain
MAAKPQTPRAIFAANVARIREQRGMTQEQLGWDAGLHQTAIARIESGEREPRLATVFRVAAALEVPPAALFEGID